LHRFSHRLPWPFTPNPLTIQLQEKRGRGQSLFDLTNTNPTETLPAYPHEEIAAAFSRTRDFTYQPDPFGLLQTREVIAALYAERRLCISPDHIALTASTSEAYALLFKLLCDPGDEILVPIPSYPLFEYLAALDSVRVSPYHLFYDGSWSMDFRSLEERITSRTRALVVVNPNNPTGSFLKTSEAGALLRLAGAHNLPIISDEVFMDYAFVETSASVRSLIGVEEPLVFSLNGLSKMAGMPQMKLAWIAISGPRDASREVVQRLELILDTYLSVNTPVQAAFQDLITIGARIRAGLFENIQSNFTAIDRVLTGAPLHALHLEGGWSALLRLPNTQSEQSWVTSLLELQDVVVQPGYFFDMPSEAYAVLSLITATRTFEEGLHRVRSHVG
jgi:aspartate/methionine/tyrosine aminotransferase